MRRKEVIRPLATKGRGKVRVEEDRQGHQWVTCSGCGLNLYSPGVTPSASAARQHARSCSR